MRLTDEQLVLAVAWARSENIPGRDWMPGSGREFVQGLIAEVRERRAADLMPDEIEALRATREEMARFDFLPEIPRLVAVLDKLLRHATPPSTR